MKRGWFAPLVAACAATLVLASVPAGALPHGPKVKLNNLKVLDGDGNPFRGTAGVIYCAGSDPCQSATADHNGSVNGFFVNPNVQYRVFGFAVDTGWGCGFNIPPNGDFYFGEPTDALGKRLARPTTFVVKRDCIELHVLDTANQPFAPSHAGIIACPVVDCVRTGADANIVFAGADANGDVLMRNLLDPAVEYSFLAYALDIDGCEPFYTDPPDTPSHYWFAPPVTGTPFVVDGSTFNISDNC